MILFDFKEYVKEKGLHRFTYLSSEQAQHSSSVFIKNVYNVIRFCFNPNCAIFYHKGRREDESQLAVFCVKCVECCEDGALYKVRFICEDGSECLFYAI